ncbi:MAG: NTP transferase domain-containing protein [Planctomycetaceae bacterium]|nr:NTP transferase domain-containing protein [Planctomycetaceae bacterium]
MGGVFGIVEVQPAIEGLSEKSPLAGMARRRFGGKTLLEWVVRRMSDAERLDGVVVLAGDDSFSKSLVAHCPSDVRVFHASESDPLGRMAAAVRHFQCSAVLRMSVSQPFVDPILIDRLLALVAANHSCDYASFALADGRPVIESKLGVFAEWCRGEAVLLANRLARRADERADATRFLHSHPEVFAIRLFPVPGQLDRDDVRLAIQDEEDWEHVQLILDALGPESLDWQFITALIDRQPTIRDSMARRNRQEAGAC